MAVLPSCILVLKYLAVVHVDTPEYASLFITYHIHSLPLHALRRRIVAVRGIPPLPVLLRQQQEGTAQTECSLGYGCIGICRGGPPFQ